MQGPGGVEAEQDIRSSGIYVLPCLYGLLLFSLCGLQALIPLLKQNTSLQIEPLDRISSKRCACSFANMRESVSTVLIALLDVACGGVHEHMASAGSGKPSVMGLQVLVDGNVPEEWSAVGMSCYSASAVASRLPLDIFIS
eukprot:1152613-Pelagomonas_calceolata.AAC.2